jgi:hypothetical protein
VGAARQGARRAACAVRARRPFRLGVLPALDWPPRLRGAHAEPAGRHARCWWPRSVAPFLSSCYGSPATCRHCARSRCSRRCCCSCTSWCSACACWGGVRDRASGATLLALLLLIITLAARDAQPRPRLGGG